MMLDRLLENWDFCIRPYTPPDVRPLLLGEWTWGQIRSTLRQAMAVDVDSVEQFLQEVKGDCIDERDIPNARPVAPAIWMEWTNRGGYEAEGSPELPHGTKPTHLGVLLMSYERANDILVVYATFFELPGGRMDFAGLYCWSCDFEGTPLGAGAFSPAWQKAAEIHPESINKNLRFWGRIPLIATSFMHCKNVVVTRKETPKRKVTGPRSDKRKTPYVKCHTLSIEPMKTILRTEGQIEKTGLKQALHICRGHFKDYSKGKGLFGRSKGLFWWDMHARGNAEVGVVAKDYTIGQLPDPAKMH